MFEFNKVKAIGITVPVDGVDIPDSEGIVGYCARVSNPSNQNNFETANRLLDYCARNDHWSVFEMCNVILEIETPRDIARQILRHRSFSFQEFSQRYAEVQQLVTRQARLQDATNRQNSTVSTDSDTNDWWQEQQTRIQDMMTSVYAEAIEKGIAKEVARTILPEGMAMSRMYMNGTVRSWMHYCKVRQGNGTQLEHIDVANKCANELRKHLPAIADHF